MNSKFSVSLMCMDLLDIKNQITILNQRADGYHIDIMDGHFCGNITLSPDFAGACAKIATLPMDAHLMTTEPDNWLEPLARAGVTTISPHAETINTHAFRTINRIRELGCKVGVVLNPATPLSYIRHYLDSLDMLTIMTVDVGYSGQPFIPQMLDKIEEAAQWKAAHGSSYTIQVDGCCNRTTFRQLNDAGAEMYVMGNTGLFRLAPQLSAAYDRMLDDFASVTEKNLSESDV